MRVFVTGATGFVGSSIVAELVGAGHSVLGLARSQANADALAAAGAESHSGSLEDLQSLKSGAAACDAVIHTGFDHDFSRWAANCEKDRAAIEAMGAALVGSDRPLIVTSGAALVSPGRPATEDMAVPDSEHIPRKSEQAAAAAAEKGVRTIVVRLPTSVHGEGDHGFVPLLIGLARQKGVSAYVGDGSNRWPAVHRPDAARVYRLALEKGDADVRYHAVAEEGVPFREIAAVIGRRLGLPVVSKSAEEAEAHFGWFTHFASIDTPCSSAWTRATLGWEPAGTGLIADVDNAYYFRG